MMKQKARWNILGWDRPARRAAAALGVLVAVRLAVQAVILCGVGRFGLLSLESADRLLFIWGWRRDPSFFVMNPFFASEDAWLPFFFWLYGSWLSLWSDPVTAPRILTLILNNLSVLPLFGICVRLARGKTHGAFVVTAFAAFSPWGLRLSLTPYFESLFILLILGWLYGWMRWVESKERDAVWHFVSIGSLTLASLTRYEGWIFTVCFLILTARRSGIAWRLSAVLPMLFWTLRAFAFRGGPAFLGEISRFSMESGRALQPNWGHLLRVWRHVFLAGTLLPLLAFALPRMDTGKRHVRDLLWMACAPLSVFIAAVVVFDAYLFRVHLVPFLLLLWVLLTPLLEENLKPLHPKRRRGLLLFAAVFAVLYGLINGPGSVLSGREVRPLPERIASALGPLYRERLAPEEIVLVKLPRRVSFREYGDRLDTLSPRLFQLAALPNRTEFDRRFSYEKHRERGGRVFVIRSADNPSLFDLPRGEIRRSLDERSVRLIVSCAARIGGKLGDGWKMSGRIKAYRFYNRTDDPLADEIGTAVARLRAPPHSNPRF